MHENAILPILAVAAGGVEDLESIKQAVFAIGSFSEVEEVIAYPPQNRLQAAQGFLAARHRYYPPPWCCSGNP